ncbi:hypothetical protein H9P43_003280 [Blastocladiella emersonii ATCC 22665]|nr:hypothetical protein H9P43_003280 [Blastocladiella emersonii ATCC 22665]
MKSTPRAASRPRRPRLPLLLILLAALALLSSRVVRPVRAHGGDEDEDEPHFHDDEDDGDDEPFVCYRPEDFVVTLKHTPVGSTTHLKFLVWNGRDNRAVRWDELERVHDRRAHIVVSSSDGEVFGHLHPEDSMNPNTNMPLSLDAFENKLVTAFDLSAARRWNVKIELTIGVPAVCSPMMGVLPHEDHVVHMPPADDDDDGHPDVRHDHKDRFRHHPAKRDDATAPTLRRRHSGDHEMAMNDGDILGRGPQTHYQPETTIPLGKEFTIDLTSSTDALPTPMPAVVGSVLLRSLSLSSSTGSFSHPISLSGIQLSPAAWNRDALLGSKAWIDRYLTPNTYRVYAPHLAMLASSPRGYQSAVRVGRCRTLLFRIDESDANGENLRAVSDLRPWLSAVAHAALIHPESGKTIHTHGAAVADSDVAAALSAQLTTAFGGRQSGWHLTGSEHTTTTGARVSGSGAETEDAFSAAIDQCMAHTHGSGGHHHGAAPKSFGPWIAVPVTVSEPGWWRIVVQVRHGESLLTPSFWINAKRG